MAGSVIVVWCCVVVMCDCAWVIFFFQAEDGIRDLVRSRGLGDVYKRQAGGRLDEKGRGDRIDIGRLQRLGRDFGHGGVVGPVSYTHLTLPTSDLV